MGSIVVYDMPGNVSNPTEISKTYYRHQHTPIVSVSFSEINRETVIDMDRRKKDIIDLDIQNLDLLLIIVEPIQTDLD